MASVYTQLLRAYGVSENFLKTNDASPIYIKRATWEFLKSGSRAQRCLQCKKIYAVRPVKEARGDNLTESTKRAWMRGCCSHTCWREHPTFARFIDTQRAKADERARLYKERQATNSVFFQSDEWLELRYRMLLKHGHRCMACGGSPWDGKVIQIDHIEPRSTHPHLELEPSNVQILCKECNYGKGARHGGDWRR